MEKRFRKSQVAGRGAPARHRSSSRGWKLLALAGLAHACAVVYGQQPGALEEIVVTAEFRETDVQDTPIAITAVNSEMLEARSQTNIVEVSAQAPNVTLTPAGQASGQAMVAFIRGIGQTDFNYAVEPGVGIYVDDIYYPNLTGSMVDLLDVGRVEILRGPQGTLAGRNSIGGAVKIFSQRPSREGGGSLSGTFGEFDRVDVRGSADLTLVEDKLYARVSGASRSRDGYVKRLDYGCAHPGSGVPTFIAGGDLDGCQIGTEGGQSYTGGRVFLEWVPSDSVSVDVIADMVNDESEAGANTLIRVNEGRNDPNIPAFGIFGNPIATNGGDFDGDGLDDGTFIDIDGDLFNTTDDRVYYGNQFVTSGPFAADPVVDDPYVTYSTYLDPMPSLENRPYSPVAVPPVSTLNQAGLSVSINWDISDRLQLRSITAYREYDSEWAQDVDASPIHSQHLLQRLVHDHWTQEFRLNGTALNDRLDFTIGAFHVDQDGTLDANVNLYYAQLNFIHGPDPTPSDASALFAHTSWRLSDTLNLGVGVRASEESKTYVYRRRNPDGTLPQQCNGAPHNVQTTFPNCVLAGLFEVSGDFSDSRTDYRVALNWNLSDEVMAYTQVATGFKGGGINPRPFFLVQIEDFQPEELISYELGLKTQLLGGRMRLNSALFFNDYTDIQINQSQCELPFPPFFGAPCLQPGNAGDADVQGVEVEAEINLADAWLLDFSFSALDFEYTRLEDNVAVTLDMITPYTPETKWSFGAQYEARLPGGGTLTPRLDVSYQDEIFTAPINNPATRIDDYPLTNARLTWRSAAEEWEAALQVTNVTEEFYFHSIFEQYDSSGTVSGTPGMPRAWALTLKRNF